MCVQCTAMHAFGFIDWIELNRTIAYHTSALAYPYPDNKIRFNLAHKQINCTTFDTFHMLRLNPCVCVCMCIYNMSVCPYTNWVCISQIEQRTKAYRHSNWQRNRIENRSTPSILLCRSSHSHTHTHTHICFDPLLYMISIRFDTQIYFSLSFSVLGHLRCPLL